MKKTIRQELFVLFRRWPALLLLLAALIGNYALGGVRVAGAEQYDRRIDAKCFWLINETEFQRTLASDRYAMKYTHRTEEEILKRYGLEDADIQELEDIFPLLARAQYVRLLWFLGGLLFLCALLPPVLIRYPLDTGVPDLTAALMGSRRNAALGKIAVFFLAVFVVSLLSTLLQIGVYAGSIAAQAGFPYVLYTVLLRLLMDMAVLSVPMYLAFCIRSTPGLVMVNTAYGVLCYALCVWASRLDGVVPLPVPAFLHGLRPLWQQGGQAGWIVFAALVSLAWIVLFSALSLRCFEKTGESGKTLRL